MGHASCPDAFPNPYLNAEHWGLCNSVKQPNPDFGSSYSGGVKKNEMWRALPQQEKPIIS
jgi:hypothetical protein